MIFRRRSNVGFAPILGIVVNVRDLRALMFKNTHDLLDRNTETIAGFFGQINFFDQAFWTKVPSCGKRSRVLNRGGVIRRPICLRQSAAAVATRREGHRSPLASEPLLPVGLL